MIREAGERSVRDLAALNDELSALQQNLAGVGLSFPLDAGTLQQIEAEIYSLESDLVGVKSKSALLKEQAAMDRRQHELELQSKRGEIELIYRELQIRKQELDRVKKQVEAAVVSSADLAQVETALANTEMRLKKLQGEILIAQELVEQSPLQIEMPRHRQ